MSKATKKLLVQLIKILFSAGIIYWLVSSGKLNFSALKSLLSPTALAVASTLVLLNVFFASERWRILIRSQSVDAKAWPVFKLSLIGSFFNFAMPGGVGGDVVKAFYFTREYPDTKVTAVTSVLMDRILGLFAMTSLAFVVMIYDFKHISTNSTLMTLFWFILALIIGFIFGLSVIFSSLVFERKWLFKVIEKLPLSAKFEKLYRSMHLYGKEGHRFLLVIVASLLSQLCSILFLWLAGSMAGFTYIPATTYFLVAPLGFMATAIPISPAGVGVGQAAFYLLFNLYTSEPSEVGPTVITAFQVATFLLSLLGAVFYLRQKDKKQLSQINEAISS